MAVLILSAAAICVMPASPIWLPACSKDTSANTVTKGRQDVQLHACVRVCVQVCACVCMRVNHVVMFACMCLCVPVCACARACVHVLVHACAQTSEHADQQVRRRADFKSF